MITACEAITAAIVASTIIGYSAHGGTASKKVCMSQITVASAGHCPVLVAQPNIPGIKRIAPEGMPLGILPTTQFIEEVHEIRAPCRVLLHTDGLTEAPDVTASAHAQERLERWIRESLSRERTAQQLRDELADELRKAQSSMPLKDDQTFLIVAENQLDDAGNG